MMKHCNKCDTTKPLEEFYRRNDRPNGRQSVCSACARTYKYHYDNDAGRIVHRRRYHLRTKFNLTLEQFDAMLAMQDGACGICGEPETMVQKGGNVASLSVDHDHACCPGDTSCGSCVRSLLCRRCNHVLGQVKDSPDLLLLMVAYLEKNTNKAVEITAGLTIDGM